VDELHPVEQGAGMLWVVLAVVMNITFETS
jgi:hypothetical protein